MNPEQFKPQPAVDISPNWPPSVTAETKTANDPWAANAYQTPGGATITECAVCLLADVQRDDATTGRRPYRAVTAVAGTPVCIEHLEALNDSALGTATRPAPGTRSTCCCAKLSAAECCLPCARGGHSHCVGPLA